MSERERCETHSWASLGVVSLEGTVSRIWECERCPTWTAEPFAPTDRQPWDETWLADR